jgi:hypothetical protein
MNQENHSTTHPHPDQRGLVAIVVVSIIIIILAILTLGFSKIMDRELRQSLDRELAMQANYAAEAGINDARVYISKALAQNQDPSSNNCAPPTGISPSPFVGSISGNFNSDATDNLVKYSCVIIDSKPRQLIWDLSNGQSTVFKMTPDKTLSTLYVSWENALYQLDSTNTVNPLPLPGDTANLKLPKEDQFGPNSTGMARVTVYPITNGLPPNPDDDLAKASNTFFMYSSGGGVASSTGDLASASYRSKGAIIGGRCNSANRTNTRYLPFTQARAYYCNAAITGLPPAPAYYVRVTSIYKPVSVAIQGQAAADGSSARLGDAEAMIDVTGEGNDVLKRQQVRVPYTPNYDYPSYAVQSMDTLCKRFRVPQVTASSVGDAFADPTVQNLQYCNFASGAANPSNNPPPVNNCPAGQIPNPNDPSQCVNDPNAKYITGCPPGGCCPPRGCPPVKPPGPPKPPPPIIPAARYYWDRTFTNRSDSTASCTWNFGDGTVVSGVACTPNSWITHSFPRQVPWTCKTYTVVLTMNFAIPKSYSQTVVIPTYKMDGTRCPGS